MKKLSAVMLALMLCVSVSFAARGGHGSNNYGSSNSSGKSSSSSGKFGLGYSKAAYSVGLNLGAGNQNFNFEFDEIAMRYWFNDNLGLDAQLGFGSGDINTRILVGAKLVGKIKQIGGLKLYWLAGFNYGSYKIKGQGGARDTDNTILAVQGGVGAEYFILPCLSVLTEMGIRYINVKPDVQGANSVGDFGVFADWLPQAGVRFYF